MSINIRLLQRLGTLALGLAMLVPSQFVNAAGKADLSISRREGYVGSPLSIKIIISDAEQDSAPDMPAVPGLTIDRLDAPMVSSEMQIINGTVTQSRTTTWTFLITASAAGSYTIPSFQINVDDQTFQTPPQALTFVKSEASELLRVSIEGEPESIYLGESTTMTLRIWVKPYLDRQHGVELSAIDMWNLLAKDSEWGRFTKTVEAMAQQRQAPRGRLTQVPSGDENETGLAYLYELHVDDWPDHIGPLETGSIRIDMQYPLSLTRNRGFFSNGLAIGETRHVSASPSKINIDVKPLPTIGQPEWFSGAVGRFVFDVTATPTDVAVGDPITITMTVRDQGRRPANLNLLQAPKLDRMPELESNFRVPREQLGGTVEGRTKVFTQTIRADNDSINEIPALPFTYFDQMTKTYKTSWSRPVAISVSPTTGVSTQDVIGLSGAARAAPDSLKNVAGGILANYTGTHLLQDESSRPDIFWLLLLLAPPIAVIGTSTMHRRHTRLQGDTARTRAKTAGRTAFARLNKFDDMSSISATLTAYVADRFDLHEGGLTRHDIAQRLSNATVADELADRIDQLLAACERHHFSGGGDADSASLVVEAERCIRDLEGVQLQ